MEAIGNAAKGSAAKGNAAIGSAAISSAMRRAVELGEMGRRSAPPNPWVGCVLLSGSQVVGDVIGEGFHVKPGGPHAEVVAIGAAGQNSRGATLVVTLEPCAHSGRTRPCVEAIINAGIRQVVIGVEDPDLRVSGQGITALRAAGIEVTIGVENEMVSHSLEAYLHHRRTGVPFTVAKIAASIDGRITTGDADERWISGPQSRAEVHELRAESQAVIIGSGTALADDPRLNARPSGLPALRQPLRVVLDGTGRVPGTGGLFDSSLGPTLVVTTDDAPAASVDAWMARGAQVECVAMARSGKGVDLHETWRVLGDRGVVQALVEGGSQLFGSLLSAGLVNRFIYYIAPVFLGDEATSMVTGLRGDVLSDHPSWRVRSVTEVGTDVRIVFDHQTS